jgi:hypothetical protein
LHVLIAVVVLSVPVLGQTSSALPQDPAFAKALISAIQSYDPAQPQQATANLSQSVAQQWTSDAVLKADTRQQVCSFLDTLGPDGAAAKARLLALSAATSSQSAAPVKRSGVGDSSTRVSGALGGIQSNSWDEAGSRLAFDGGSAQSDAPAVTTVPQSPSQTLPMPPAPSPAGGSGHPAATPVSPNLPAILTEPPPPGSIKIVSVAWPKLQKIAQEQIYTERKADFNKAFDVGDGIGLGGGGGFGVKILNAQEVANDPIKQSVRDEATKKGEKVVFVRTDTKAQLNGTVSIPLEIPGGPANASASAGLRLSGLVEVVETRAVPEDKAEAVANAEQRVFMWPLTAQHLRDVMKVGEDLSITGRLDEGASASLGVGAGLGNWQYANVGASAGVSVGPAKDQWVTLHVLKTDPDHVRILVQRANGEVVSANVSAQAGLNLYDASITPTVTPPSLEDGMIGKAVVSGESSLMNQVQKLASASLSDSWSKGKDDMVAEGWASVDLSDPKVSAALDSFLKFRPDALRDLPADETFSQALKAGRIKADIRDVTHSDAFQAHISKLKIAFTEGTEFYEVRWNQGDGPGKHYLVGVAYDGYHGDVTKTNRAEQSVMWYDLDTGQTSVTVSLGPEDRLMTTTRERINDVIATQEAMGVMVQGKIDEPSPYLQLFHLANYGRSEEKGSFYLAPEGVKALGGASREQLIAAYLHSDWLYEKQSWPPGQNFWAESKPPVWANTIDPQAIKPAMDFLHDNAAEVRRLQGDQKDGRGQLSWLEGQYSKLAPGRTLVADASRYVAASDYANQVHGMQASGQPEEFINLFLKFRSGDESDLKRAVMATAFLAGSHNAPDGSSVPNWKGYDQMTGSRVTLVPKEGSLNLPEQPISQLNDLFAEWLSQKAQNTAGALCDGKGGTIAGGPSAGHSGTEGPNPCGSSQGKM